MYWIDTPGPGRLAIAARPRAGDWLAGEVEGWREAGVTCVVSLLEPHEIHDLELDPEPQVCATRGIAFLSFPISDRGVPDSLTGARALVGECQKRLALGEGVLVHCRAGIGRSGLIAACVLARPGDDEAAVFGLIAAARGLAVPDTVAQSQWVRAFLTH